MGKNSRQRHAAKRRRAAQRRRARTPSDRGFDRLRAGADPFAAAGPYDEAESDSEPCGCAECCVLDDKPGARAAIEADLMTLVAMAWGAGWQPDEIYRHIPRRSPNTKLCRTLLGELIAADAVRSQRRGDPIHPSWKLQTDRFVSKARCHPSKPGWFDRWIRAQADPADAVRAVIGIDMAFAMLRVLPKLLPPPGERECDLFDLDPGAPSVPSGTLVTIRAVLAKAESTPFPAEAEAFTAKAQAMMTAEQIDAATVRAAPVGGSAHGRASARRLMFDEPYVDEQASLLNHVALANDCQMVVHRGVDMATVVGPADVIGHVELLFTSLLIQVHTAMVAAAEMAEPGDRRRSRTYRSSFIVGFASRIGDRLSEAREAALVDAVADALPVLAADHRATSDLVDRLFGRLSSSNRSRTFDRAGLLAGAEAADRARLREDGLRSADDGACGRLEPPGAA